MEENSDKNYGGNKRKLLIMLLVGLLLLVISIPSDSKEEVDDTDVTPIQIISDEDYKLRMENELSNLLRSVEGVGEVQVMITLSTTTKKIVEKDKINKDLDIQEETIYEENSNGQSPYVNQEIYPEIGGVIVSAGGGDNPVIIKNITEGIQALFHIETHKIKVMKMK